jgi:hypothetical protein
MTQTIELESIRALNLKPGEVLVAGLPAGATQETAHRLRASLRAVLPVTVSVLVVSDDVDLTVLCPPSPASPADD